MSTRNKEPQRRPRLWLDLDDDLLAGIELAAGAQHQRPGPFIVELLKLIFVEETRAAKEQRSRNRERLHGLCRPVASR